MLVPRVGVRRGRASRNPARIGGLVEAAAATLRPRRNKRSGVDSIRVEGRKDGFDRVVGVVGAEIKAEVREEEEEEEEDMDEYDSGRSGDKGAAAEDDGSAAPLPEKVFEFFSSLWLLLYGLSIPYVWFFLFVIKPNRLACLYLLR